MLLSTHSVRTTKIIFMDGLVTGASEVLKSRMMGIKSKPEILIMQVGTTH